MADAVIEGLKERTTAKASNKDAAPKADKKEAKEVAPEVVKEETKAPAPEAEAAK